MKCTYCKKKIVLVPSARERAKKFGGKPSDYINRFTIHPDCLTEKRKQLTLDLILREYQ